MKLEISLKVPLFSTEDKSKVESCIKNLLDFLPELKEVNENGITILTSDRIKIEALKHFYFQIRQSEILDTVRRQAHINPQTNQIIFIIHKQALLIGKIAVVSKDTTSPLGHLELIINAEDANKFLDWFAPHTVEGKIQNPSKFNSIFSL